MNLASDTLRRWLKRSDEHPTYVFGVFLPWIRRQQVPPKRRLLPTTTTFHKADNNNLIFYRV